MGLVGAVAAGNAAPILYDLNFSGGTPNPISGSFTYDAGPGVGTPIFSNFVVTWQGITFDVTSAANSPTVFAQCAGLGSPETTFALLTSPTICSGPNNHVWGVANANSSGQNDASMLRFGLFASGIQVFSFAPNPLFLGSTIGNFDVTTATPEPGSMILLLAGAIALLACKQGWRHPPAQFE
jgi:hypothetical protein